MHKRELGAKLFERTNHSVSLTDEGLLFRRRAQDIVALATQDVIRPGDLIGTLVFTIHINTPEHKALVEWSGEFARDMDFCANYNVLHNAVIVARERKGAVICLEQDCHYDDMFFLPLDPPLLVGSVLAWNEGQTQSRATKAFLRFLQDRK